MKLKLPKILKIGTVSCARFKSYLLVLGLILCSSKLVNADEVDVGREEHEKLLLTERFYKDEDLEAYIDEIGQRLAANGDWPEIEYHFSVVDSGDINAFALPGGYIYVNRGLLNYLTSEAQLAAVLAHEIAHVTRHHYLRSSRTNRVGNLAAFMASLITMNTNVGEAVSIWNATRVSGFGRDMELEADEYGAEYLYKTGYDPQAMIEVLSILKDHQTFVNQAVRSAGGQSTYHGIFSTHPRGDTRLKEVVAQAGFLPPGEGFQGRDEYREITDGMVFGPSANSNAPPGKARYVHKGLAVTFVYPDDWLRTTAGSIISIESPEADISLQLEVEAITDFELTAEQMLLMHHSLGELPERNFLGEFYEFEDAVTGVLEINGLKQRVAAIKVGSNVFFFSGVLPGDASEEIDQVQLDIMASFRQASNADLPPDNEMHVYYRRLEPGETFAEIAKTSPLGPYSEQYLRMMNGYYPTGEPQPGTWMKLVK